MIPGTASPAERPLDSGHSFSAGLRYICAARTGRASTCAHTMETTRYLQHRAREGDAEARFRLGYRLAYGRGRPRSWRAVRRLWEPLAAAGHARAQFHLGQMYEHGRGVRKDIQRAVLLYRSAADQGHERAPYLLGCALRDLGEAEESFRWFERCGDDLDAWAALGYAYHEGIGVAVDHGKAVRFYSLAASLGVESAQFNLGLCYLDGDGVEVDRREGLRWIRRAAKNGSPAARR